VSHWQEFIDTMTPERADRIRYYMIQLRTPEGMDEEVSCLMCAVNMLGRPDGKELAERLAQKQDSRAAERRGEG
jgi:hypothetical protein